MNHQKSADQIMAEHIEKANVDFNYKFKFFICGLIFAVLSFAIQHPITVDSIALRVLEILAWAGLLLSGYFSLLVMKGYSLKYLELFFVKIAHFLEIQITAEVMMWRSLYTSLFILLIVKGMASFC